MAVSRAPDLGPNQPSRQSTDILLEDPAFAPSAWAKSIEEKAMPRAWGAVLCSGHAGGKLDEFHGLSGLMKVQNQEALATSGARV